MHPKKFSKKVWLDYACVYPCFTWADYDQFGDPRKMFLKICSPGHLQQYPRAVVSGPGIPNHSFSITWEFVRNANLEALPKPTEWKFLGMGPEIGILTSPAGELMHDKNWPKAHIKNLDS